MNYKFLKPLLVGLFLSVSSLANAGLITASTDSALAGATILDFDSEVDGSFISRMFNGEVTISTTGQALRLDNQFAGIYGMQNKSIKSQNGQNYIFDFSNTISAFGWDWGAADLSGWVISLLDSNSQLIASYSIPRQTNANGYADFYGASGQNISRVIMENTNNNDYAMIDNFSYVTSSSGTAASVPEPSSLVIFALGMMGLVSRQLKKTGKA